MSSGNYFVTKKSAYDQYETVITGDHTVQVGGDDYNFKTDRVVNIADPAAALTVTVPNGTYEGQQILITYTSGTTYTVTVTITTGTNFSLTTAGDFCSLEWVNSVTAVGWVALASQET